MEANDILHELQQLRRHLERVETTLNEVLGKLKPVSAHAEWVDGLRQTLHKWNVVRDTRRIEYEEVD